MKDGRWQAKDIDDVFFLSCVDWASMQDNAPVPWEPKEPLPSWSMEPPHWVLTYNLQCLMPMFPAAVILAKASALMRRGLLTGCDCGCRGDFELTRDGAQVVYDATGELHSIANWNVDPL